MGIVNKIKDAGKWMIDKYRERDELLGELTISQLKQLAKDYDIDIFHNEMFDEEPQIYDYIRSISESRILTEDIGNYIRKFKNIDTKLSDSNTNEYITHAVIQD